MKTFHVRRKKTLAPQEARDLLLREISSVDETEELPLEESLKRVLAIDLFSPEDLPGFDRSTMDGYALCSADTFGASETFPSYFKVIGEVRMGKRPAFRLKRGEAAQIATGGMIPEGADAVVMFEYTNRVDDETLEVLKQVAPGENIIRRDEDIRAGELILSRGHLMRPQDLGALAGLGITRVRVYRRPVVTIIPTGDEVVPAEVKPEPGQVRDINSYNLFGLISLEGAIAVRKGIVSDDRGLLKNALREALDSSDMVLVTGGSSVGNRDYTVEVIDELGSPGVLFHGVMMKPGKPLIGAVIDSKVVLGLPGHPAAVTVCFDNFVRPALRKISGRLDNPLLPERKTVRALFGRNLSSFLGREDYVRVYLRQDKDSLVAEPILGKSGLISTLVRAVGYIVIPKDSTGIYEGEEVEVFLYE